MTKHHKRHKTCVSTAKIHGSRMVVKGACNVKAGGKTATRTVHHKSKHHRVTDVPAPCKGLKKANRRKCARTVCEQRPKEYRKQCLKAAGLR